MLVLEIALLLVGFVFLIKGADWLVEGASALAKRWGVSDLAIGLTIVAFGTSAPELAVNLFSALSGSTDLAIGNVVGSNIANVLLILGAAACVYPLAVKKGTVWKEIPLMLLASLAVVFLLNDVLLDRGSLSVLTRGDGLTLLLFFVIFLYYTYGMSRVSGTENMTVKRMKAGLAAGLVAGGLVGLVLGGKLIVDNAVLLALRLGLSESLIGLTIVAVGTSLPELATSIIAALKRNVDIAVGNVVGSNIFNLLFILAITSTIQPLPSALYMNTDLAVMLAAALFLFLAMFVGKKHKLERWQGASFLALYAAYVGYLVYRG